MNFSSTMTFFRESSMHTRQELSTMTAMLSLLLVPNNNFTLSSKVVKKDSSLGQGHCDVILFTLH